MINCSLLYPTYGQTSMLKGPRYLEKNNGIGIFLTFLHCVPSIYLFSFTRLIPWRNERGVGLTNCSFKHPICMVKVLCLKGPRL